MKFLIAFIGICCISFALSENPLGLSEKQLEILSKVDLSQLPEQFKALKVGDNSHWCCTNDQPVQLVQRTKIEKEIHIVATKIKTGYTSCGFNGWMMCSVYSTRYKQVAVYHIATYEVPNELACPDHHVNCCTGYVNVGGNCHSFAELGENMDLITQLVNLSLIQTIGK